MSTERKGRFASFIAAAGAIGLAGVLTRSCPGACTSCATCASTLFPMGVSAAAVGSALVGSAALRAKRGRGSSDRAEAPSRAGRRGGADKP